MKKNLKLPKYSQGVARVAVPEGAEQPAGKAAFQSGMTGAATGASIGSVAGPWGTAIGAVVGGASGAIYGAVNQNKINEKIDNLKRTNTLVDSMNRYNLLPAQYVNDDNKMLGTQLKNGIAGAPNTKAVEIEGGEDVYRKENGKFRLKHSASGPSHGEGGIPYVAEEGDIIVPKDKSNKWLMAYKKQDHETLEDYRKELPKDYPQKGKYWGGTNEVTTPGIPNVDYNYGYNLPKYVTNPNPITTFQTTQGGTPNNDTTQVTPFKPLISTTPTVATGVDPFSNEALGLPSLESSKQAINPNEGKLGTVTDGGRNLPNSNPTKPYKMNTQFGGSRGVGMALNALELAPTIYNALNGFGKQAQVLPYYQYQPKMINEHVDVTKQLNDINKAVTSNIDAMNNYAGGNASNLMSNLSALRLNSLNSANQVNMEKAKMEQGLRMQNIASLNDAQKYNLQNRFMIDDYNNQSAARRRDYQAAAVTGASDYLQSRRNTATMTQLQREQNIMQMNILGAMFAKFKGNVQLDQYGNVVAAGTGGVTYTGSGPNTSTRFYNKNMGTQVGNPPRRTRKNMRLQNRNSTVTNNDVPDSNFVSEIVNKKYRKNGYQ